MGALKEKAYDQLLKQIMKAPGGTVFSVRKSAEELGISYTPVREALLKLQNEGLLEQQYAGFTVVEMNEKRIKEICQCRECVEDYVLPLVVNKIDEDDIRYLRAFNSKQEEAVTENNSVKFEEMDAQFHIYLIDTFGNSQLTEFYRSVRKQYRVGKNRLEVVHSMLPVNEHKEFLEFIEHKEFEKAVDLMKRHTKAAVERMKDGYVQIGI